MDINQIVDGWKHFFVRDPVTEKIAKQRLEKCGFCPRLNSTTWTCKICNCYIPAAVRAKSKKCPLQKW